MKTTHLVALFLASFFSTSACQSNSPAPANSPSSQSTDAFSAHVMRTYKVPPGHEQSLEQLLKQNSYPITVVSADGQQTQFVTLNPQFTGNGYMVLSAPVTIHEGISDLLSIVGSGKPQQAAKTIQVDYWLVLGTRAPTTTIGDELSEVAKPLKELSALGTMKFELYERLSISAIAGEAGKTTGRHTRARHRAIQSGTAIQLEVDLSAAEGSVASEVETRLNVRPEQFAVLGQAGFTPRDAPGKPTLFYIARARVL